MTLWPLALYFAAVVLVVAGMIAVSHVLGERHRERATADPYESGIPPTGSASGPHPARFYLVAVMFVIFDLEAVFLITWAVAVPEAGWTGFVEIAVFAAVLLAALVYLVRCGTLDWGSTGAQRRARERALRAGGGRS